MINYKNDFTKDEDFALWQLHEIRSKLAARKISCDEINNAGQTIIKKYNLKGLKINRRQTGYRTPPSTSSVCSVREPRKKYNK